MNVRAILAAGETSDLHNFVNTTSSYDVISLRVGIQKRDSYASPNNVARKRALVGTIGGIMKSYEVIDFYEGFEGEGEIQFIQANNSGSKKIIRIWDGYFDDIMGKVTPDSNGWTSLAYCYHLVEGWYEETPWELLEIDKALQQLNSTENSAFRFEKTHSTLQIP